MKRILIYSLFLTTIFSCNLDENLQGFRDVSNVPDDQKVAGNLAQAQLILRSLQDVDFIYVLQEHPSDEMAGPTRGADWFDGGAWQQLHLMTWTPTHPKIIGTWNQLLGGIFYSTDALSYNPTTEEAAKANFYKSFYTFLATDIFGQVPYRIPGESFTAIPAVYQRTEAIDNAISSLEAVMNDLPTSADPASPNKYNAATLLAKMYLNKAVYHATASDGTPETSITFDPADMQKVVTYCDEVINSGNYSLQANYFDGFGPDNTAGSTEAILSSQNDHTAGGEVHRLYFMTMHYNQNPSGWNGFVMLTDVYNKFDSADPRLTASVTGLTDVSGLKAGILVGPQYDQTGTTVKDRQGNPLSFTQSFSLSNSTEEKGMRVIKYYPDYASPSRAANDFMIFRLADVYLMKAEAMARMGQDPTSVLQALWTARGVTSYTYAGLSSILDERARELYWEGWRRQDQIRFGTFLNPVQERTSTPDATKLIFPIPLTALSANPNLKQNPGY